VKVEASEASASRTVAAEGSASVRMVAAEGSASVMAWTLCLLHLLPLSWQLLLLLWWCPLWWGLDHGSLLLLQVRSMFLSPEVASWWLTSPNELALLLGPTRPAVCSSVALVVALVANCHIFSGCVQV
jgi:hypothetical protein